jgi:mannose-1-phosphate guanylyltransferase
VHRGEEIEPGVYRVREFKEKPQREVAEQYLQCGEYYWNSGMFVWRVGAIQDELQRHLPENHAALTEIAEQWPSQDAADRFRTLYKTSIDFGVMEKAASVFVVEMNCDWLDLGSWTSIAKTREPDEQGNVAVAENAIMMDGQNNIVVSEDGHLLVTLGVEDVIVVHSDDATLVCRRDHEQAIKALAEIRREAFDEQYE